MASLADRWRRWRSRGRKTSKLEGVDRQARGGSFVSLEDPLLAFAEDHRRTVIAEAAAQARRRFESTTTELLAQLAAGDPSAILASVACQFQLYHGAGIRTGPRIEQHHVELLQALVLRAPREGAHETPLASSVTTIIALLMENTAAFQASLTKNLSGSAAQDVKTAQYRIRSDTQTVRGEFHPVQMDRYLRGLLSRVDVRFQRVYGVTGTQMAQVLDDLLALWETRWNLWRRQALQVATARGDRQAIEAFAQAFADGDNQAVRQIVDQAAVRRGGASEFLAEHAWLHLARACHFDVDDIRRFLPSGVEEKAVMGLLERWSLAYGDLASVPADEIPLCNPVWTKPFIRLADGAFECPSPSTVLAFKLAMFESLIRADDLPKKGLKEGYERVRGRYLEAELVNILKAKFGARGVLAGLTWKDHHREKGEADAVVLIDRTAIVFEAKAGNVTDAARRGGDLRLASDLGKLVAKGASQTSRFEDLLSRNRGPHVFDSPAGVVEIDSREIDRIIRYNVVFNGLGPLTSHWPSLVKAGLIGEDVRFTPTVGLGDLDLILEVLEEPAEVVHYLRRRAEFEQTAHFVADEYDLLAFYLDCGFEVGLAGRGGTLIGIYGMSRNLDGYLARRPPGAEKPTKPRRRRTDLWRRMLADLALQEPPGWLEIADRLLRVDDEAQAMLEGELASLRRKVLASKERSAAEWRFLLQPVSEHRNPVAVVVCTAALPDERTAMSRRAAEALMDMADAADCLVLTFDARSAMMSYADIGLALTPTSSSG